MSELMRSEFERTNGRDHRRQPPKGKNYVDPMAQADWESFQKGWSQSRAAVVIELPADCFLSRDGLDEHYFAGDIRDQLLGAIKAAGVRTSK